MSKRHTATFRVPQGSIQSHLLFFCYVNDMPISVQCKLLLYADNSALLVEGKDTNLIAETLLNELNSCRHWLIDNQLSLHLGKIEDISFGSKKRLNKVNSFNVECGEIEIKNVNSVNYLVIQLDDIDR